MSNPSPDPLVILAYGGHLWSALFASTRRALSRLVQGNWSSFCSIMLSAFGTAAGTAAARMRARSLLVRPFYVFVRAACMAGAVFFTVLLFVTGCFVYLSADECDVLVASLLSLRRWEWGLNVIAVGLGHADIRPNTRSLLMMRKAEAYMGFARSVPKDMEERAGLMRRISTIYSELRANVEDFDPQNRPRFFRSLVLFYQFAEMNGLAQKARQEGIDLARLGGWTDQEEKLQAMVVG